MSCCASAPHDGDINAFSQDHEELDFLNKNINKVQVMIAKADAGVQPRTMMVEPFNAFSTYRAMSGSACSNDFAIRAKRSSIEHF